MYKHRRDVCSSQMGVSPRGSNLYLRAETPNSPGTSQAPIKVICISGLESSVFSKFLVKKVEVLPLVVSNSNCICILQQEYNYKGLVLV